MNILIIGGGPRGLSTALYALYKGHKVTLIDDNPLHTWAPQYLIPDIEMRSPLTFDLVTFLKDLQQYSLAKYLNKDLEYTETQVKIEANSIRVSRVDFYNYLKWVYSYIQSKATIVKQKIIDTQGNRVLLSNGSFIEGDAVIFCLGYKGLPNSPTWLEKVYSSKIVNLSDILKAKSKYAGKSLLVVGSGQGAAEIVYFLSQLSDRVYWSIKKQPKVTQYPAPIYSDWGIKSALGSYYRGIESYYNRLQYFKKVKEWQPSITPYISNKLKGCNYERIYLTNYTDIANLNIDYIIQATGIQPNLYSLPTTSLIPSNPYLANFPDISNHFRINLPNSNWYVSGILATAFDGPRQHSLISAGITAKEIVEDIESGNI